MNIERIVKVLESVMPNLTSVHEQVVDAVSKSDLTVAGVIASVNNNVYPIGNVNYSIVKDRLEKEEKKAEIEETVENHRKLWNWIADKSEEKGEFVKKDSYFIENNLKFVSFDCYLCEYYSKNCGKKSDAYSEINCYDPITELKCLIKWGANDIKCQEDDSPYVKWQIALENDDLENYIKYAREIANLSLKEEYK